MNSDRYSGYERWLHGAIVNQADARRQIRERQIREAWGQGEMPAEMGAQLLEILSLDTTTDCPAEELMPS